MSRPLDVLFLHPNASNLIYQNLSFKYSAIEPPIWAALLAKHCNIKGFNVELMDCEALHQTDDEALYHIKNLKPKLIVFVIYGQQPSASTQNMEGAIRLAKVIKQYSPYQKILFVGGHISALTEEVMRENSCVDFACQNEGVYTISTLLQTDLKTLSQLTSVPGLVFRYEDNIIKNVPGILVPQEKLEFDLPGMFWDLLPMKHYRTSLWHSYSNNSERQPFASVYTSLGCPFSCQFCCINSPFGGSSFRYWNPEFMIKEFDLLAERGIKNIKIADEMFVMNVNHFMKLCQLIIDRGHKFNIWAYARVDITKEQYLETLKKAGVNWLALGIESGNKSVRKNVIKGRFDDIDIRSVVKKIQSYNINVMGNYIFGLPEDSLETMQETLDLALEMNTEACNMYSAMAYPGSKLHTQAKELGWKLPKTYSGYSQHAYDIQPLPTKYLSAEQVLKFRDEAWMKYHTNPAYLELLKQKFGQKAVEETKESTQIQIKRKILEVS